MNIPIQDVVVIRLIKNRTLLIIIEGNLYIVFLLMNRRENITTSDTSLLEEEVRCTIHTFRYRLGD